MLENIIVLILNKSDEIVFSLLLRKFSEWVLSEKHLKRLSNFVKLQILVLYLDWVLQKTPFPGDDDRKAPSTASTERTRD